MKTLTLALDKIIYLSYLALAVITPLLFTTITTEIYEVPKMLFVYLLSAIVLFSTLFKFSRGEKINMPTGLPAIAFGIFLVSQVLSTLTSIDTFTSIFGYPTRLNGGLLSTFSYFVLFTGALINLNADKVKNLILALIFTAVAVSLWGIPSHFNRDPSCLVLTGKLTSACWQKEFNPTLRIFSTFGQPNWLASYLVLVLPITLALTITFQKQKQVIFAISSVLIFWALILTNSRSGLLGLGVALSTFAALLGFKTIKSNLKIIGVLIISFAIISFLFADTITSRIKDTIESSTQPQTTSQSTPTQSSLTSGGTESGQIRLIVWQGVLDIWKHWPILGPGPETFVNTYYQFRPAKQNQTSEWEFYYNKAHNEFLNYLATSGAVGLLTYLFLCISLIYAIAKSGKLNPQENNLQKATIAAILGYLTTIFFGFSTVATQTTFFIICASTLILVGKSQAKTFSFKLTTPVYQKILQTFVVLLFAYTLTIVARLYLADVQTNNAQSASNARALVRYNSAITTSPTQNPYLLADFAYNTAMYAQNTQDMQNKEALIQKATDAATLALHLAPNNYLTTQKVVKTYIILANIDPSYTQTLETISKELTILAPTYPPAYLLQAQAYVAIGDKQTAKQITNRTLELKPDYLEAQKLLDELTLR